MNNQEILPHIGQGCVTSPAFDLTLNVLLHVTILFLILGVFFEVYISQIITDALNKEISSSLGPVMTERLIKINEQTKGRVDDIKAFLPADKLKEIYKKPTSETTNNNAWVTIMIITLIVMMCTIIFTMVATSYQAGECPPIKDLLIENALIFAFVGIIEATFFITIISHYVPTPPSAIAKSTLKSMKRHLTPK